MWSGISLCVIFSLAYWLFVYLLWSQWTPWSQYSQLSCVQHLVNIQWVFVDWMKFVNILSLCSQPTPGALTHWHFSPLLLLGYKGRGPLAKAVHSHLLRELFTPWFFLLQFHLYNHFLWILKDVLINQRNHQKSPKFLPFQASDQHVTIFFP